MERAPAFTISLAIVIGALAALFHPAVILFIIILFDKYFIRTVVIGLAAAAMVWCRVELPAKEFSGAGPFNIASMTLGENAWLYRGEWYPRSKAIPVTISIPDDGITKRPPATSDWWVKGDLRLTESGRYKVKIDTYQPWVSVPHTWNLGEWRLRAKDAVKKWIESKMEDPSSATFLTGIATGTFDNEDMTSQFSRFGLQHIMAISGFHFALIAGFLGWCLRPVLGHDKTCIALIFLLTLYCIFLGSAPSVMRAWATLIIALAGSYFGRTTSGLNALGIAIGMLVVWDPLLLHTIGFCFSCLTTAAILLFYGPSEKLIVKILPKRKLDISVHLTTLDQHGYCLASLLRGMLSLTLAVNVVAIPVTLFYFQYFPMMSLIYNLFFPLFVTVSMVLLILSIPLPFLHPINEFWTKHMLDFTSNMPTYVDIGISGDVYSGWILGIILSALFLVAKFLDIKKVTA